MYNGKYCLYEGILPRLGKNEEWWSKALGVNERMQMLCESMNCSYLDVWEDFLDNFKLYKKDRVHLNDEGIEYI